MENLRLTLILVPLLGRHNVKYYYMDQGLEEMMAAPRRSQFKI